MVWLFLSVAIAAFAGVVIWCMLAITEAAYGYPVGRSWMHRVTARRAERHFLSSDIGELDETFRRVVGSHAAR